MRPEPVTNKPPEATARGKRIPGATYRLQFHSGFTFAHARDVAGYLRELGITDVYASPLFAAGPQSTHGYDVCGYDEVNPGLGGRKGWESFAARLRELGLGLLLDMVPNHMGTGGGNRWWTSVLEQGPASPWARFFDIDWRPAHTDLRDQVLLPTLEDHYARVLEAGKLRLHWEDGGFGIAYHDRRFPVALECYPALVGEILAHRPAKASDPAVANVPADFRDLAAALAGGTPDAAALHRLKEQLAQGVRKSAALRAGLERLLAGYNDEPGPRRFDRLHRLLQAQHYRLAHWRVGPEEINYRRFFDVTELVSLRMELPEVFAATHELVCSWIAAGTVTGLRIDHPDGLRDPRQYFRRLQERCRGGGQAAAESARTAEALERSEGAPFYVVAEKILTGNETLRADWPVDGTTGYDFLNRANGLFVDPAGERALDGIYREFTGCEHDFRAVVFEAKQRILEHSLASELDALTWRLKRLAGRARGGLDFTRRQLQRALAAVIAAFPVYRTYVAEDDAEPSATDREYVLQAVREAKGRRPQFDPAVWTFIERLLLLQFPADFDTEAIASARDWVMRFQQLTGPVMAKGCEDTAFYNYNRLASLNEVGGDPAVFGVSPEQFHAFNRHQAARWPHTLLATATHDTKRGEDVRARLNALAEIPGEWRAALARWRDLNAGHKRRVGGQLAPHPNDEYLFYQNLLGAWPPEAHQAAAWREFTERLAAATLKSVRESKARTSWTDPAADYEAAMLAFVRGALEFRPDNAFLRDCRLFQQRIGFFGVFNSLAQVLLKLTCPGVPDFYQGTELWDFNLVDPDNRRPVDFAERRRVLGELQTAFAADEPDRSEALGRLLAEAVSGRVKLFVTWRALQFRQNHRALFDEGIYLPLSATGRQARHLFAFARVAGNDAVVAVVPRLVAGLTGGEAKVPCGESMWSDTALVLPPELTRRRFRDAFSGRWVSAGAREGSLRLAAGEVLRAFPVALLEAGS